MAEPHTLASPTKEAQMSVLLIAGTPSERSRSAALLDAAGQRLALRGVQVERLRIRDLAPQALLLAETHHPTIAHAIDLVANARVVVVATPIYKAAYSGVLKLFLDLLPQRALAGKTVLPLATGGSASHLLALDYALRPVLLSMGAPDILPSIYATESQLLPAADGSYQPDREIGARLDDAVHRLVMETLASSLSNAGRFATVPFEQVRCSV